MLGVYGGKGNRSIRKLSFGRGHQLRTPLYSGVRNRVPPKRRFWNHAFCLLFPRLWRHVLCRQPCNCKDSSRALAWANGPKLVFYPWTCSLVGPCHYRPDHSCPLASHSVCSFRFVPPMASEDVPTLEKLWLGGRTGTLAV